MSTPQIVVHVSQGTDWWASLLSGFMGAVVGTLGAFGAAWFLIRGQRRSDAARQLADRQLAAEERRKSAAAQAYGSIHVVISKLKAASGEGVVEPLAAVLEEVRNQLLAVTPILRTVSRKLSDELLPLMHTMNVGSIGPLEQLRRLHERREEMIDLLAPVMIVVSLYMSDDMDPDEFIIDETARPLKSEPSRDQPLDFRSHLDPESE